MKYCNCYVYVLNFDFNIINFNIYIYSIKCMYIYYDVLN